MTFSPGFSNMGASPFMNPDHAELIAASDGSIWPLGETCIIGRHASADITLPVPNVSRQHAMIRYSDEGYSFFDLDSANGCSVNGSSVREPVVLRDGDRVSVAEIEFEFRERSPSGMMEDGIDPTSTMMISAQSEPMVFLVADIIGYTEMSEKLPDGELGKLMSPWYERCRDVLKTNNGQLDKFIGDCVFAYWRGTGPNQRASAVIAAKQLVEYQLTPSPIQTTMLHRDTVDLRCGVGLHIGKAAVGSFTRGNRTALGDEVNLTFRVEKLTRDISTDIVATAAFLEGWDAGRRMFTSAGEFELKGIARKVEVYKLEEA